MPTTPADRWNRPCLRVRKIVTTSGESWANVLTVRPSQYDAPELQLMVYSFGEALLGDAYSPAGNLEMHPADAHAALERILGPLDFRRPEVSGPVTVTPTKPMTPSERRVMRALELRLACEARDALAAEVIALRAKVAELQDQVYYADSAAQMYEQQLDIHRNYPDCDVGITQAGQIVPVQRGQRGLDS